MTAGIAKITMNDVTTCAQTKIGMRLSDMPGARSLNAVVISRHRDGQRRDLGERDQLRPDVGAFGRRVERLRERRIGEPADVGPGVQQERDVRKMPPNRNIQ